MLKKEDVVDSFGSLFNKKLAYYCIINFVVQFQSEYRISVGTVKSKALGTDGVTADTYDDNLILNLIVYEVELQYHYHTVFIGCIY